MNVASLVSDRYVENENRKRALRQKSAGDAYRKNAQYFKPKFNPALEELVGLLTGKKEQEHLPEVQAAIHDLKQHRESVAQDEQIANVIAKNIQDVQDQSSSTSESSKVIQLNGQEKVEITKQRLIKKAISRYAFHVQMAKQGFQFAQPTIYLAV